MIGYITIGTKDMEQAMAFWSGVLEPLGASVIMDTGRLAMIGTGMDAPMLAVCLPHNEEDPSPGNGNMVALRADSRENVAELHARAMHLGASDEGAPGERNPTFYGGYFRDPDGNKAVFFHISLL